jgi:MFS family permease
VTSRTTWSPNLPILSGAAAMLSLSMGLRQCFGLLMQPLTRDLAVTVSDFTLAMAVQNLGWGLLQPIAGALAVRLGFRPVMLAGAVFYLIGLVVLASARGFVGVLVGAGLFVGLALAVGSRAAHPAPRSMVLGAITAAGSLGAILAAPIGQTLSASFGWRAGVLGFAALALGILPAAFFAGRIDRATFAQPAADPARRPSPPRSAPHCARLPSW